MKICTRSDDDKYLTALRMLADGAQIATVAGRVGVGRPYVSTLRQKVMAHDLKYSGEPESAVVAAYHPKLRGAK